MSDSHYQYPKHHVAVDCIIFGYEKDILKVLLSHRRFQPAQGDWSLIGGWIREEETAEKAAERVLVEITGLKDIYLEQVEVFSKLDRDPGGRVISIVFYAMIRLDKHDSVLAEKHGTGWIAYNKIPKLVFDHEQMLLAAHEKLKLKASYELIGQNLLPTKFTLTQLRKLYEAIFQRKFDPGNFRKKVLSLGMLEKQTDKNTSDSKKGAYYYRFENKEENLIRDNIVKRF
ncbi:MAG: NUDIX hydrolase [Bacteroidales bacterium]|nr:NUDIX hydrolase [Bacteroidales bacterium]